MGLERIALHVERNLEIEAFHTPTRQIESPEKDRIVLTMVSAHVRWNETYPYASMTHKFMQWSIF